MLYIKKQRRSSFDQIWSVYLERVGQQDAEQEKATNALTHAPVATATTKRKVATKIAKEEEADGEPTPSAKKKAKQGSTSADKTNQKALRYAQVMKSLYHKVICMQASKLSSLEHDSAWACLKTDANLNELKDMYTKLQDAASGEFETFFLNNDIAEVRRSYKDDMAAMCFKLQTMHRALDPPRSLLTLCTLGFRGCSGQARGRPSLGLALRDLAPTNGENPAFEIIDVGWVHKSFIKVP